MFFKLFETIFDGRTCAAKAIQNQWSSMTFSKRIRLISIGRLIIFFKKRYYSFVESINILLFSWYILQNISISLSACNASIGETIKVCLHAFSMLQKFNFFLFFASGMSEDSQVVLENGGELKNDYYCNMNGTLVLFLFSLDKFILM